jgi:hypothetical protein
MKYLLIILLCSCNSTKSFVLDGSQSQGNIVKYEWKVNGLQYDNSKSTSLNVKRIATVELIVTDNLGRSDTAIKVIR